MGIVNILVKIIGTYILLRIIYQLWRIFEEIFLLKELNLIERYGKGTWAFITGSSDGIGLGFANHLAARGFNIILCARNPEKLERRMKEILSKYPSVKIEIIVADFSNSTDATLSERIAKELKGFDVSILVNNVGLGLARLVSDCDMEQTQNIIKVNCVTPVLMAKIFLEKVQATRKNKRSAVIELSSTAQELPISKAEIYSATKRFNAHFGMAVQAKVKSLVDYMVFKPSYVSTAYNQRPINAIICTVDDTVTAALKVLG